jgi:hypothetical protein
VPYQSIGRCGVESDTASAGLMGSSMKSPPPLIRVPPANAERRKSRCVVMNSVLVFLLGSILVRGKARRYHSEFMTTVVDVFYRKLLRVAHADDALGRIVSENVGWPIFEQADALRCACATASPTK